MAQVLIRNLDEDVVARLKRNAEAAGLSLEAYLRKLVTDLAGPSRAQVIDQIDALRKTVRPPAPGEPLAEDIVREMRDERAREIARRAGLEE
jgi:plasmid stability protein